MIMFLLIVVASVLTGFISFMAWKSIFQVEPEQQLFFISYTTQKKGLPARFQNCIVKERPLDWQVKQNDLNEEIRYKIISWKKISENDARLYSEKKGQANDQKALHR